MKNIMQALMVEEITKITGKSGTVRNFWFGNDLVRR